MDKSIKPKLPVPQPFYLDFQHPLICENHIFKKTEPSELDQNNTLLWQCVKCGHKKASM
jgi:hypothetical protein